MTHHPSRYSLAQLADRFGLKARGDPSHAVSGAGTLDAATADDLAFLANPAYRPQLTTTRAGIVILREEDATDHSGNCLVATDPYLAYARIAVLFDHRPLPQPGIHPLAHVSPSVTLGAGVYVGPGAVIGEHCQVGDHCSIGPNCVLGDGCVLGISVRLVANVTLGDGVRLGARVIVHPGAVIGADGFGLAFAGDHWEKVPQLGSVVVGDDCEIGANTCIDRGAIGDTVLEEDVRIDNQCQVGHNCHIGAHTAMAGFVGIAGSTRIGRFCMFAGRSGAHGHIEIADRVTVAAMTMVKKSITEPGTTWSSGIPARPIREWQRIVGHLNRIESSAQRLKALERSSKEETHNDD
jgi:UDP-3-O-[3-hydroxymyristoyl] glucosamine N-acyltransferase